MSSKYIERRLMGDEGPTTEEACLASGGVIVVLAEPGAGKSDLLTNFASKLRTRRHRASIYRHRQGESEPSSLVIDALDEVARQDQSAVNDIIVKAIDTNVFRVGQRTK